MATIKKPTNTGVAIQNPNKTAVGAVGAKSNKMTTTAPQMLTTCDNQTFEIAETSKFFMNNYAALVPAHSTANLPLETHTFFAKLAEKTWTKDGDKSLAAQCTSESIKATYIKMLTDGLSLYDGQTFLIKYGNVLTCQPAAKGRAAQAIAVVAGLDRITAIVVYEGEKITSHFEHGIEVYDHTRDMSKRINSLDNIIGVYGYAFNENGELLESKYKTRIEIVKDWTSNNRYMPTQKVNGKDKKIFDDKYDYYTPYLSDSHINRTEAMFIKTMEASLATILKAKYPHNEFKSKYFDTIISNSNENTEQQGTVVDNKVYGLEDTTTQPTAPQKVNTTNVVEVEEVDNNDLPELPDNDNYEGDEEKFTEEEKREIIQEEYEEEATDEVFCVTCGKPITYQKTLDYYAKNPNVKKQCYDCSPNNPNNKGK